MKDETNLHSNPDKNFDIYRPRKKPVTFRIDLDNLLWLKGSNQKGYQTRLNEVIRWARNNGCPIKDM